MATSTPPSQGESQRVATSVNAAAFALHRELTGQGNLLFSPLSVYCVLRLLYEGARGETRRALGRLLGPDSAPAAPPDLRLLLEELESLTRSSETETRFAEPLDLRIANGIWIQDTYPLVSGFLPSVRAVMDADVASLDFAGHPERSCDEINAWIADRTRGRISDMLSNISPLTRAVIGNAVYFKAGWDEVFGEPAPGRFYRLDGSETEVQMMRGHFSDLNLLEVDDFWAIELPYRSRPVSMLLMIPRLPGAAALTALERQIVKTWSSVRDPRWHRIDAILAMPSFEIRESYELIPALGRMGLGEALGGAGDWSGITEEKGVGFDRVQHDTYIKVDQFGTEAIAATLASMYGAALEPPPEPRTITIDRPFLFGIWHWTSGVILFLGKVENP